MFEVYNNHQSPEEEPLAPFPWWDSFLATSIAWLSLKLVWGLVAWQWAWLFGAP